MMTTGNGRLALGMMLLLCAASVAEPDASEPLTILTNQARSIDGTPYREITAMMNGVAPGGAYRVPVTLLFPEQDADSNCCAVVDAINTTALQLTFADTFDPDDPAATVFFPPTPAARQLLGDTFLASRGYTYASVEWNKESIDMAALIGHPFGPDAHIAEADDAPHILADLSALLKDPPTPLRAVSRTIAFGESQSSSFLSQVFFQGGTTAGYDGAVLVSGGCDGPCDPAPLKVLRVNTETDLQLVGAAADRDVGDLASDDYRVYEIAGVSHLSRDLIDIQDAMETLFPEYADNLSMPLRQNPGPLAPVVRAMTEHMRAWLYDAGYEPPPSVYLDGPVGHASTERLAPPAANGKPTRWQVFEFARDADGNATGGVRLPHVRTGTTRGAPLGTHNGLEREAPIDFRGLGVLLAGTFVAFSQDEIDARYTDHATYVQLIRAAADHALARGWILAEDREAYIEVAAGCPVGRRDLTLDEIVECIDPR